LSGARKPANEVGNEGRRTPVGCDILAGVLFLVAVRAHSSCSKRKARSSACVHLGYLLIGTDSTARKLAEEALLKRGDARNKCDNHDVIIVTCYDDDPAAFVAPRLTAKR
jgi:hypothetical protein